MIVEGINIDGWMLLFAWALVWFPCISFFDWESISSLPLLAITIVYSGVLFEQILRGNTWCLGLLPLSQQRLQSLDCWSYKAFTNFMAVHGWMNAESDLGMFASCRSSRRMAQQWFLTLDPWKRSAFLIQRWSSFLDVELEWIRCRPLTALNPQDESMNDEWLILNVC